MDNSKRDRSTFWKVRMKLTGDVHSFIPAVAERLVSTDQAIWFDEEMEQKAKVETAAINKGTQTTSRNQAPLRQTR